MRAQSANAVSPGWNVSKGAPPRHSVSALPGNRRRGRDKYRPAKSRSRSLRRIVRKLFDADRPCGPLARPKTASRTIWVQNANYLAGQVGPSAALALELDRASALP